jgi:hypothetical protein
MSQRAPLELGAVAPKRGQLPGSDPLPGLEDERRRGCHRPERVRVGYAQDVHRGFVSAIGVLRCRVQEGAHPARGHADIAESRAGGAKASDRGGGSFVHRDVVGMPIEAVLVEGDDYVRLEPADGIEDVRLELRGVDPREHAILVVEQYDISEAQNLRRIRQFAGSGIAKLLAVVIRVPLVGLAQNVPEIMAPTMLTMREAEK